MKRKSLDICLIIAITGLIGFFIYFFIVPYHIQYRLEETEFFSLLMINGVVILISWFLFWINMFGIALDRKEYIWAVAILFFSPISLIYYKINRKTIK